MLNKENIPQKNLDVMAYAIKRHIKRLVKEELTLEEARKSAKTKLLMPLEQTSRKFVKTHYNIS